MLTKITQLLLLLLLSSVAFAASAKNVIFEYHPTQGYILITAKGVVSEGIHPSLRKAITQLQNPHATIKSLAFTPDGKGWSLVTKNRNQNENVSAEYLQALQKLQAQGASINSITFNPLAWESKQGFLIVHNKGYVAHNIPASLKAQLEILKNLTQYIKIVRFTPDGGWTIIADQQEWSRMIQGQTQNFLDNIHVAYQKGHKTLAVGFNPKNYSKQFGWLLITEKGYGGLNIPTSLKQALANAAITNLQKEDVQ
jgi:hypothetical protein